MKFFKTKTKSPKNKAKNLDETKVIKFKRLNSDARTPTKTHSTDAGFDIYAVDNGQVMDFGGKESSCIEYGTGIAIDIPKGYVGKIYPRSSISKKNLSLCNSVGIIDSGYQGEIKFRFNMIPDEYQLLGWGGILSPIFKRGLYKKGDRIGQIIIEKLEDIKLEEISEFKSKTERGSRGFGSSGR